MNSTKKLEIVKLAEKGEYNKAKIECENLCKLTPNDAESWFLLGSVNGALEDFPAAEACCRKAIQLTSKNPMLTFNLGIALFKQGKASEAIEQFEKTITLQPQHADAYHELANAYNTLGNINKALQNYKKTIELNPNLLLALHNLADTYRKAGEPHLSIKYYEQALSINSTFADSCSGLALVLIGMYQYDRVINLLEEQIQHCETNPALYFLLGVSYQEQGKTEKAISNFRKTLEINPNHIDAQVGLASILALQGNYKKAGASLEKLLAKNPENQAAIITYVTYANQFDATDNAIDLGSKLLSKNDITKSIKSKLLFALANLHEKKGNADTAFAYYQKGNKLRDSHFDKVKHYKMFESFTKIYSKDFIETLQRKARDDINPIFIVGMPRSGTSLAEQILASHTDVFGAGELPTINRLIQQLPQKLNTAKPYPQCIELIDSAVLDDLANEYLKEASFSSNGEKIITDKMPLNAIHLGFISLLFPNARIIHCTRDPKDTCLSCFFTNFSGEHAYAFSLTSLGEFYRMYETQMEYWKKTISNSIFELSYEDIVANPEQVIRKLIEFCDLEWNDACLNFHTTKRTVATASHNQVRQKMYSSSVGKWHNYKHHLTPLFTALDNNK